MKLFNSKFKFLRILKKFNLDKEQVYFILTLTTGVLAAAVAIFLKKGVDFLTQMMGTNAPFTLKSWLLGGAAVLVSGYITTRLVTSTSGSGIPYLRVSLAAYNGQIQLFKTIAKFFASLLSLSSGMSLGREGPTVAIAGGIGSYLGEVFNLSKKRIKLSAQLGD